MAAAKKSSESRWKSAREWASFVFSFIALIISSIGAYYGTLTQLDDLRVLVLNQPDVNAHKEQEGRILVTKPEFEFLFMNSGTRPIAILQIDVVFGKYFEEGINTRSCPGTFFPTNASPFIVDEKKVIRKNIWMNWSGMVGGGADPWDRQKEPYGYSFSGDQSANDKRIDICVAFTAASPSDGKIYKLIRTASVQIGGSTSEYAIGTPATIVHSEKFRWSAP